MYRTDNPLADFEAYEWERERQIAKLPICSHCDEPITDDTAFFIEGEWICENCMNQFRKVVESEDFN